MPRDVFISYCKEDKVWADRVRGALETEGISCWIAPRDIPPGQEWPAAIVAGIKRSSNLLLILSSHSSDSRQIARELETADRHHLNIISFRVEDVQPPESLEYFLQNIQWLDAFGGNFEDALLRLISELRSGPKFPATRSQIRLPDRAAAGPPPRPASPAAHSVLSHVRAPKTGWTVGSAALLLILWYLVSSGWDPRPDSAANAQPSGVVATGTGAAEYSVYDPTGKTLLKTQRTNVATDLVPGNYLIELLGVRKPVTVRTGRRSTLPTGTLAVTGAGLGTYSVFDAAGKEKLGARKSKEPGELFPGDYTIELEGVRKVVHVSEGGRSILSAGTLVVAGAGKNMYTVYDAAASQRLASRSINTPIELLAGDYVIEVQSVRKPVTIREGKQSTFTTGTFAVTGTGKDMYAVYDSAGNERLGSRIINTAVELFPGNYTIGVHGVRKLVVVGEGQRATLTTGAFAVTGKGTDVYGIFDAAGEERLGTATTNGALELFPGNYTIELHGVRKTVVVAEGQQATLTTGTLAVTGTGAGIYGVFDAAGKDRLGAATTNAALELFPGDYTIELQGVRKPAIVRESKQTTLITGTLVVAGTGADTYTIYDAAGKTRLGSHTTNGAIDLLPGSYMVEHQGVKNVLAVRAGQKSVAR